MTFPPTPPNQCPYQVSTSYTLPFLRYSPDKIFELKVTTARSKVKSRSGYDVAHLHILTNVPTKYELSTPYGFWDTAWTNFFPVAHPSTPPDTMGENNTPTALQGCGVKMIMIPTKVCIFKVMCKVYKSIRVKQTYENSKKLCILKFSIKIIMYKILHPKRTVDPPDMTKPQIHSSLAPICVSWKKIWHYCDILIRMYLQSNSCKIRVVTTSSLVGVKQTNIKVVSLNPRFNF